MSDQIPARQAVIGHWYLNNRGTRVQAMRRLGVGPDADVLVENEHGREQALPASMPLTPCDDGSPEPAPGQQLLGGGEVAPSFPTGGVVTSDEPAQLHHGDSSTPGLPTGGPLSVANDAPTPTASATTATATTAPEAVESSDANDCDDGEAIARAWAMLGDAKHIPDRLEVIRAISDLDQLDDLTHIKGDLQSKCVTDLERHIRAVSAMRDALRAAQLGGKAGKAGLKDVHRLYCRQDYQDRLGVMELVEGAFGDHGRSITLRVLANLISKQAPHGEPDVLSAAFWYEAKRTEPRLPLLRAIIASLGDDTPAGYAHRLEALKVKQDTPRGPDAYPQPYYFGLSGANVSVTWEGVEYQWFLLGREEGERWDALGMTRPAPPVVAPKPPLTASEAAVPVVEPDGEPEETILLGDCVKHLGRIYTILGINRDGREVVVNIFADNADSAVRVAQARVTKVHVTFDDWYAIPQAEAWPCLPGEPEEPVRDAFEGYDVDRWCDECGKAEMGAGEGSLTEDSPMRAWVVCRECYRCGECGCEDGCEGDRPGLEEAAPTAEEPEFLSDAEAEALGLPTEPEANYGTDEEIGSDAWARKHRNSILVAQRGLEGLASALPALSALGIDVELTLSVKGVRS